MFLFNWVLLSFKIWISVIKNLRQKKKKRAAESFFLNKKTWKAFPLCFRKDVNDCFLRMNLFNHQPPYVGQDPPPQLPVFPSWPARTSLLSKACGISFKKKKSWYINVAPQQNSTSRHAWLEHISAADMRHAFAYHKQHSTMVMKALCLSHRFVETVNLKCHLRFCSWC